MSTQVTKLEHLTTDEFEREMIADGFASAIEPDDPAFAELDQLSTYIANLINTLPHKQRLVAPYLHPINNMTTADITEKTGASAQTVHNARKNPAMKQILALQERALRIRRAPQEFQRLQMAWRIAKSNEISKPSIALKALDLINKQLGVYRSDDDSNGGLVVKINNFTVNSAGDANEKPVREHDARDAGAIDAEFTPITVEIPSDA